MAFNPTPAQQAAIDNRGAMLVSAAAGSGKTAVLVERIMGCILDPKNPVDVNQLLVVTFTTASAGEMRDRIAARLQEELAKDPDNLRLMRQQMLLPKANIGTIDAFCKTLITGHFEQLDISPDFKLISGNSLTLLQKEAVTETLDFFFETKQEEFTRLAQILGANKGTFRLETALGELYRYLRTIPFPRQWAAQVVEQYNRFTSMEESPWGQSLLKKGRSLLKRYCNTLSHLMSRLPEDAQVEQIRGPILQETLNQWQQLLAVMEQEQWDETVKLVRLPLAISYAGTRITKNTSDINFRTKAFGEESKKLATALQSLFSFTNEECKAQAEQLAPYVALLFDCIWELDRRIAAKKADLGALDFSDIEYAALRLLVEWNEGAIVPTPHAKSIQEGFAYVLVDEFQDVNDLQSAIFDAISIGGKNLFVVGDIKQSIYRFRKANPNNFARLLESYPLYDGVCDPGKVILDGNFRSRREVCGTVNTLFSLMMSKEAGDVTYDASHQLNPQRAFPPLDAPAVFDFLETDDRSAMELEADRIAMHIQEALATPCVTQGDTLRPATYGDCVILLRSDSARAGVYIERLRKHGIPAVSGKAETFFNTPEVSQVMALLRAIDNPTDDVPLLAAMMSPFFGFTADEMAAIRGQNKSVPLYTCVVSKAGEGDPKTAGFLETLEQLRTYAATVTPAKLLRRVYDRFGYFSAVQILEKGQLRRQNLLTLMDMAEECSQSGYDRLDGFVRYFMKLEQEGGEMAAGPVPTGNHVRIMSIHGSKGLQFPLCFVAYCNGSFNKTDLTLPVLLDEKLGLGLKIHNDQTRTHTTTCMRQGVEQEVLRGSLGEELRVLYVAMTRAIDRLYLLATFSNRQKAMDTAAGALEGNTDPMGRPAPELVASAAGYSTLLLYTAHLCPHSPDFRVLLPRGTDIPLPPVPGEQQERLRTDDPELVAKIREQIDFTSPYARLEQTFSKRSVSQLVHGDIPPITREVRPGFLQEGGLTAAEKGTALHEFMQYADYKKAAQHCPGEIARLVEKGFITPVQGDAVDIPKAEGFFQSPLYRRMEKAHQVLREYHFMSTLPVTDLDDTLPPALATEEVVIQGIADCLFEEDGRWVIVDYKTDRVKTPEELTERYGRQLQLYAKMVKDSAGMEVKELILYSFHLGTEIQVPLA